MWSYKIVSHEPLKTLSKNERRLLRRNDKEAQFALALRRNPYKPGERVRLNNTKTLLTIINVIHDINQINWQNNHPYFIEVVDDFGKTFLAAPFQLTRKRVK
jgi:hypothetical protein